MPETNESYKGKVWVDKQYRVQIPKHVRDALKLQSKSYITYKVIGHQILLEGRA